MSTIKRFEDLEISQEASRLAINIGFRPSETDLSHDFRFKDQVVSGKLNNFIN